MKIQRNTAILILAAILLMALPVLARAGGGSNSSGGGGLGQLLLLPFFIAYSAYVSYKLRKKGQQCQALIAKLDQREKGWDTDTLMSIANRLFFDIQQAWTAQDVPAVERLSKGPARSELVRKLDELKLNGRINRMDDLSVLKITVLNIQNFLDDEQDNFTVKIEAKAKDYTVDQDGKFISANTSKKGSYTSGDSVPAEEFSEFWTFEREGDGWVLLELAQAFAWKSIVARPMIDEGTAVDSPSRRLQGGGSPSVSPA